MRFVSLPSRGGNYLVVAQNVAWLRQDENGQVKVGIVGGQPLLVTGTLEEIAAIILDNPPAERAPVEPQTSPFTESAPA